jgi:hypothetical protein
MQIQELQHNTTQATGLPGIFKVPVNAAYGDILSVSQFVSIDQKITLQNPYTAVDKFTVVIRDRWGYSISMGSNYSFSLEFSADIS